MQQDNSRPLPSSLSHSSRNAPPINLQAINSSTSKSKKAPRFVKQSSLGNIAIAEITEGHYLHYTTICPAIKIIVDGVEIIGKSMYEVFLQACTGKSIESILELVGADDIYKLTTKEWKKYILDTWRDKVVTSVTMQIVCARIAIDADFLTILMSTNGQIRHYPVRVFGIIFNQIKLIYGRINK